MIKRLRIKFICINMSIASTMVLVIFGILLNFTAEDLERQSIAMIQEIKTERFRPGRQQQARDTLRVPWFCVSRNPFGEEVVTGSFDLSDEEEVAGIIRQARESSEKTGVLKEHRLRFSKEHSPHGEQIIFVDISVEWETLWSLLKTTSLLSVLSLALFFVISILLARWAVRPVEAAWNQQRQFVADASHELKTPLTVIMTNAELLQDPLYGEQDRKTFSESILTMSHQMRGLVESLLDLARVDNGTAKMVFSRLNFSELAAESLLPFEPVYFERQLQLESSLEEDIFIDGSPGHLKQVLDILLDNGAKYTSPGGTLHVTLNRQGNCCLLTTSGPGDPISREDLKNIFKRFYRVDKARSRDGSYGLGLAIAESIVKAHKGRIWAESEGGTNTFFVQIPLS